MTLTTLAALVSLISLLGMILPIAVAVICAIVWWKRLAHPGFFLLMGALAVSGVGGLLRYLLHYVYSTVTALVPQLLPELDAREEMLRQYLVIYGVNAVLTIILGTLLLRAAMRRQLLDQARV